MTLDHSDCFQKEHMFFDIRVEGRRRVVPGVKCYDLTGVWILVELDHHEKGGCFEKEHMFFDIRVEGRRRMVSGVRC